MRRAVYPDIGICDHGFRIRHQPVDFNNVGELPLTHKALAISEKLPTAAETKLDGSGEILSAPLHLLKELQMAFARLVVGKVDRLERPCCTLRMIEWASGRDEPCNIHSAVCNVVALRPAETVRDRRLSQHFAHTDKRVREG